MRWIASAAIALGLAGVASSTPFDNSAPTANDDWAIVDITFGSRDVDVIWNDTDPDLPNDTLRVVSVSGANAYLFAINSAGTGLVYGGPAGYYPVQYTIEDALGAQSTATLEVYGMEIICGPVECW